MSSTSRQYSEYNVRRKLTDLVLSEKSVKALSKRKTVAVQRNSVRNNAYAEYSIEVKGVRTIQVFFHLDYIDFCNVTTELYEMLTIKNSENVSFDANKKFVELSYSVINADANDYSENLDDVIKSIALTVKELADGVSKKASKSSK